MITPETLEILLSILTDKIKTEPLNHSIPELIDAREEIANELQMIRSFNLDVKGLSRIGQ